MIEKADEPIEFEVSMGNYGNKFDNETQASSSTTEPTQAIFGGNKIGLFLIICEVFGFPETFIPIDFEIYSDFAKFMPFRFFFVGLIQRYCVIFRNLLLLPSMGV